MNSKPILRFRESGASEAVDDDFAQLQVVTLAIANELEYSQSELESLATAIKDESFSQTGFGANCLSLLQTLRKQGLPFTELGSTAKILFGNDPNMTLFCQAATRISKIVAPFEIGKRDP